MYREIIPLIAVLLKVVIAERVCDLSYKIYLGPVVQSIVSLTSSLRGQLVKCFMTL